jgi:threonine synthase
VGPEHALLHDEGRVEYASVTDGEALAAFHLLGEAEGILPALESAHAVAWLVREAEALRGQTVVVNMSGRGDKDLGILESAGEQRATGAAAPEGSRTGRSSRLGPVPGPRTAAEFTGQGRTEDMP